MLFEQVAQNSSKRYAVIVGDDLPIRQLGRNIGRKPNRDAVLFRKIAQRNMQRNVLN